MHQSNSIKKKSRTNTNGEKMSLTEHYLDQIQYAPGVKAMIGDAGRLINDSIKSAADFSYFADKYSGDHYRIIGDAASKI
jgi:flavine halogenase